MTPWISGQNKPKKKRWYDLCHMRFSDGRQVTGWWNGSEWEGIKYRGEDVIQWRHVHYDE